VGSLADLLSAGVVTLHGKGVNKCSHVKRKGAVAASMTPAALEGVVYGARAETAARAPSREIEIEIAWDFEEDTRPLGPGDAYRIGPGESEEEGRAGRMCESTQRGP
jgi:hypothetical protein